MIAKIEYSKNVPEEFKDRTGSEFDDNNIHKGDIEAFLKSIESRLTSTSMIGTITVKDGRKVVKKSIRRIAKFEII